MSMADAECRSSNIRERRAKSSVASFRATIPWLAATDNAFAHSASGISASSVDVPGQSRSTQNRSGDAADYHGGNARSIEPFREVGERRQERRRDAFRHPSPV